MLQYNGRKNKHISKHINHAVYAQRGLYVVKNYEYYSRKVAEEICYLVNRI